MNSVEKIADVASVFAVTDEGKDRADRVGKAAGMLKPEVEEIGAKVEFDLVLTWINALIFALYILELADPTHAYLPHLNGWRPYHPPMHPHLLGRRPRRGRPLRKALDYNGLSQSTASDPRKKGCRSSSRFRAK